MPISDIIYQLQNYSGTYGLKLRKGATESQLQEVEHAWNITLPNDFKEFYRFTDGFDTSEYLFNFLSLSDIIENRLKHNEEPFYVAEYMIYSDTWALEINPDDHNDYKIVAWANKNKLILTNSLAEFVDRFLKGGIFDTGGLYYWHEEVEARPIYSSNPGTLKDLLTVYYYGLIHGLISRKEIIDWADRIITFENEPDLFFIEISLSNDVNGLIEVISNVSGSQTDITVRVIFGLLYDQLNSGAITTGKAIAIIDSCNYRENLTDNEIFWIYDITDYRMELLNPADENEDLAQYTLTFLNNYKQLELANYKRWPGINYQVESNFKSQRGSE